MSLATKGVKWYLKLFVWLIFLIISVIIFAFSHQPAEQSTEVSQSVLHEVLEKTVPEYKEMPEPEQKKLIKTYHSAIRKAAHLGIYALWGLTLSVLLFLYKRMFKTIAMTVVCGGFLYASSDEIHQKFVGGRAAEFTDILIDVSGVALGFLCFLLFWRIGKYFFKLSQKKP